MGASLTASGLGISFSGVGVEVGKQNEGVSATRPSVSGHAPNKKAEMLINSCVHRHGTELNFKKHNKESITLK
ncbi:hypothetical protein BV22DRAFT_1085920 [Leucogyrophana mollusca]|uniref:Uncharacterized protein n=1 Tax=Leucogyrophana mollusca TaxID=85980 RepID=A0ACB8BM63_9AGAM|nr:hypothetical protein BV22DRAFT_1085920 [Leucogyrophana mollusca]